ncbi:hypothetical protein [Ktedonobacter racemifer]|uniref:Uncharacterized protein n=1 Tax=Ktedonobacter racemifer DSM 44963 TaxID=485913 RepID=D6U288_KTERA|nr:hypothetical protein [Ktedonobacter racemifer]EFH82756.1 hypothetical protein Krac_3604 [Ktedonobacter racemifer DSM 44963]
MHHSSSGKSVAPTRRHRSSHQWYNVQTKLMKMIGLGCGMLLVVLLLCSCGTASATNVPPTPTQHMTTSAPGTAVSTTPTSVPTATPTSVPTPTPTKKPQMNATDGQPHIGGPVSDFVGKYGQPVVYTTFNDGSDIIVGTKQDTNNIVTWISVTGPQNWTFDTTRNYCLKFTPSGAVQDSDFNQGGDDTIVFHKNADRFVLDIFVYQNCVWNMNM